MPKVCSANFRSDLEFEFSGKIVKFQHCSLTSNILIKKKFTGEDFIISYLKLQKGSCHLDLYTLLNARDHFLFKKVYFFISFRKCCQQFQNMPSLIKLCRMLGTKEPIQSIVIKQHFKAENSKGLEFVFKELVQKCSQTFTQPNFSENAAPLLVLCFKTVSLWSDATFEGPSLHV